MAVIHRHIKRVALEGLGWLLVAAGIAAIVLPGPGLLMIFAGMALLSTQYEWAEKRVVPIRKVAIKGARDSVETWPRIISSIFSSLIIIAVGIVWGLQPDVPGWWPLADKYWLIGGWGTGGTIIGSSILALGILAYSFYAYRNTSK